jgi:hypothetical protein
MGFTVIGTVLSLTSGNCLLSSPIHESGIEEQDSVAIMLQCSNA